MLQRSTRRARLLALPAVLLLGLAACGGDDDDDTIDDDDTEVTAGATEPEATSAEGTTPDDDEASGDTYEADEYVDALVGEIGGDEEGATCVAQALTDAIGTDRLEASGVPPQDLADAGSLEELDLGIDESTAPQLQADLEACPSLIDLFGEAADASDEEIDCVRENVSQAQIAELFVVQFTGGTPSQELIDAQAGTQTCFEE